MDNPQGSLIWNEGDADSFSSLIAIMGWGIWRVEAGKNSGLFHGFHQVMFPLDFLTLPEGITFFSYV